MVKVKQTTDSLGKYIKVDGMEDITSDIINRLNMLIGINMNDAKELFKKFKIESKGKKNSDGFVENLVAVILERELPGTIKGMDFNNLFEVKKIAVNKIKNGEYRVKGDTPISNIEDDIRDNVNFYDTNLWDKTKRILVILEHEGIVVDFRIFNAHYYEDTLLEDYNKIKNGRTYRPSGNIDNSVSSKDLTIFRDKKTRGIMIGGGYSILLSKSLSIGVDNNIQDQEAYCEELFGEKLKSVKVREKVIRNKWLNTTEYVLNLLENMQELDFVKIENRMNKLRNKHDELANVDLPF